MGSHHSVSTSKLSQFLSTLNSEQRDAVTAPVGPALVLAGAGSGKTRVLTGRVLYLLMELHVPPHAIVVMTFTNKAAGELKTRIVDYVGRTHDLPWAGTFHGFCARLLRQYGTHAGLAEGFTIYDTDDGEQVLAVLLQQSGISKDELSPALLRSWISFEKNGGRVRSRHPAQRFLADLRSRYDQVLLESNAVDFDDLLRLPLEILRTCPEIRERIQRQYDHVLIDEFQDTNVHQYELARELAAPQLNLFAVGDDDQSIYAWRGADASKMLSFTDDIAGSRLFRLEQNYRSTQAILDVANDIIAHGRHRHEKRLWTENKGGEKATLRSVSRSIDEANEVVGELVHQARKSGYKWSDFAILFRTNALSRPFEDVLVEQAIPYAIIGGLRFYERKEVKDLLAYLRVIANPRDEQAWKRVLKTPPRGIGEVTLKQLEDAARQERVSIGQVMLENVNLDAVSRAARLKLQPIQQLIRTLIADSTGLELPAIIETALSRSGLVEFYSTRDEEESEERIENLSQLVAAARERERLSPGMTLVEFLAEVALVADADSYDDTQARVTLMTLHAAKGLEFPVVFIVGLEDGILPHKRSIEDSAQLEEERRLFYVGVTRARERLNLSFSQTRTIWGSVQFQEPSRFLHEIDRSRLRGWTLPSAKVSRYDWTDGDEPESRNGLHREPRRQMASSFQSTARSTNSYMPYRVGDMVEHEEFGTGVVTAKSGDMEDMKIRVAFQGMGSKLLSVKHARLKRLDYGA